MFISFADGVPLTIQTGSWWVNSGDRHHLCESTEPGAVLRCEEWNIEYCKAEGHFYAHMAGSGPGSLSEYEVMERYWAAPEMPFKEGVPEGRRMRSLPTRYSMAKWIDNLFFGRTEYCSVCNDWMPCDETDYPCKHIEWCGWDGWWDTPSEPCACTPEQKAAGHER